MPPDVPLESVTALFVSPHLDDVVFSCGGLVAQLAASGARVVIASVFTEGPEPGEPVSDVIQSLHKLWKMEDDAAVTRFWCGRREEDAAAVGALGAQHLWLAYRDALYRGGQYFSVDTIMNHVKPGDWELVQRVSERVVAMWRRTPNAVVYLPLAVGNHVDHQFAFMLAGPLRTAGAEVWHYEDFPYVAREPRALGLRLAELGAPYRSRVVDISQHIEDRLAATALYGSQLESTFGKVGPYRDVTMHYAASVATDGVRHAERLWTLDHSAP
jgi:LmbE family N-acetylglucosaminyl deacetylase